VTERRTSRVRPVRVLAASAFLGAAFGLGGASLALWQDAVSFDGQIGSGYESFAAGLEGQTASATGHSVTVTVGAAQAAPLVADGELAVVLQTDSLSQRSEEHTSELQSRGQLVCRLLLVRKKDERVSAHPQRPQRVDIARR